MLGEPAPWSPWRYLREKHPGFHVHEVELEPGLLGCTDHQRRLIWLDSRLTAAEKRCTLAHELGHLALDTACGHQAFPAAEQLVDEWAASRLIRGRDLARSFSWSLHLSEIAEELFVDVKTLRARIRCATDEEQDWVMAVIARRQLAA